MAAAGEIEAEADLGAGASLGQVASWVFGDQAWDGEEYAERDDSRPPRSSSAGNRASVVGRLGGGVRATWLRVDLTTRTLTPWRDLDLGFSSLTLVTRPRMPPPVTTSSPFLTAAIVA